MSTLEHQKLAAWHKAHPVIGHELSRVRRDDFGWYIQWSDYGNRDSAWGWEINHQTPTNLGGTDRPSNLRALHWHNNASRGGLVEAALR